MEDFNIFDISSWEEYRLCCYRMTLMELLSSEIITLEDFNNYNSVIVSCLKSIKENK